MKANHNADDGALDGDNYIKNALSHLGSGDTAQKLGEELLQLVKRVRDTGKKGKLTLELEVSTAGARGQVLIKDKIKPTYIDDDRGGALFFTTEHGQLLRNDPNQKQFPFDHEDVDAPRIAPKESAAS